MEGDWLTEEEVSLWITHLIAADRLDLFYKSKEWYHLRKEVLAEYNNECIDCKAKGFYTKANTVHHQNYIRKHPRYALSKTYVFQGTKYINLVPLCHEHHEERHGYRAENKKPELTPERW